MIEIKAEHIKVFFDKLGYYWNGKIFDENQNYVFATENDIKKRKIEILLSKNNKNTYCIVEFNTLGFFIQGENMKQLNYSSQWRKNLHCCLGETYSNYILRVCKNNEDAINSLYDEKLKKSLREMEDNEKERKKSLEDLKKLKQDIQNEF